MTTGPLWGGHVIPSQLIAQTSMSFVTMFEPGSVIRASSILVGLPGSQSATPVRQSLYAASLEIGGTTLLGGDNVMLEAMTRSTRRIDPCGRDDACRGGDP